MRKILDQIKKLVVPSKKLQQKKTKIAKQAFNLVREEISKYSQILDVEFGGSFSKGTWLITLLQPNITKLQFYQTLLRSRKLNKP